MQLPNVGPAGQASTPVLQCNLRICLILQFSLSRLASEYSPPRLFPHSLLLLSPACLPQAAAAAADVPRSVLGHNWQRQQRQVPSSTLCAAFIALTKHSLASGSSCRAYKLLKPAPGHPPVVFATAWMKSKLLQAVGLGPHWRPPKDGPPDEEPAEGTPRTGRRQRRPPVALQHAQLDSQGSGSSEQAARSRQGPDGRSQGSGGDGRAKRARWQGATSAPPPPAPAPPMVVLVVADPQGRVPAWPGIMQLPASLAAGRLPFVQAANGGWQLPAGDMLLQQVQEAQQQAAQQAWKQQQAQQVWQQAQQAQQAPQQGPPPALLSIEDVLLPQVTGAEDAAQQAAWEALRGVGFVPSPAGGPAAAPMPAHVSRTVTTGAALPGHQQQQAFTQAVGRQLAVQQPAAQRSVSLSLSRSAGASPGRPGKPAPSPFAAEAARPVLVEEQCGPQCAPLPASQPGQPLQGGGGRGRAAALAAAWGL